MEDERLFAEIRYRDMDDRVSALETAIRPISLILAVALMVGFAWLVKSASWSEMLDG